MVDGININIPFLSGSGDIRRPSSKAAVVSKDTQKVPPANEDSQFKGREADNVSSVISKSAEKRFDALSSGNVMGFLDAAEKIIDAAIPDKPPGTKLRIILDDDSGRFVYQGIDIQSGDVVTQFPSEEILKLIAFNREREGVEGIVVDEEV